MSSAHACLFRASLTGLDNHCKCVGHDGGYDGHDADDDGYDGDDDGHDGDDGYVSNDVDHYRQDSDDDKDGDLDVLALLVLPGDDTVAIPPSCLVGSWLRMKG